MKQNAKHKLCILTTVVGSIRSFYSGQLGALNNAGFETTVVCADDSQPKDFLPAETRFVPVGFSRTLSPFRDMKVLWNLYWFFRKNRFDIIQYSTLKASLLGSIAAFLARAPVRVYILWGLYYMGQGGWFKKSFFKVLERIVYPLSTNIVPISHEMVDFALGEGLGKRAKYEVMHNGSACGIDLPRFNPEKYESAGKKVRSDLDIPQDSVVIGTVARLTGNKGINELVRAFDSLSSENQSLYLLIVGEQEDKDRLESVTEQVIAHNLRIKAVGRQQNPLPYYAAMDIFCLPTYREGFGEVNLEAQAMRLPVVSTNVIGPRESVDNGVTGFLVEPKSSEALIEPLRKLINDADLRNRMGQRGRIRVERYFDRKDVIQAVVEHRLRLLGRTNP